MRWLQSPLVKFALCALVGFIIWALPSPEGVTLASWRIFAIFVATILGVIFKPYPTGTVSLVALTVAIITGSITLDDACSGFGNDIVWLVVFAFFIAKGFISTGLGSRIAFGVMSKCGKSSLGLGYGLVATDLILAPCIPSATARAGGIVYPILKSLVEIFSGKSHDPRLGAFLTLSAFQGTTITSAMFLTAMAGNPMVALLAKDSGVIITWTSWALAAIVPGLISLIVMPLLLYRLWPPSIRQTPHAKELAEGRLRAMGPMSMNEKIMLVTFILLVGLWVGGKVLGIKATAAAMVGVSILLLTGILKWKDVLEEHGAWDTLIWFATLMTLACTLNKTGFTVWFSQYVVGHVSGFHWSWGFPILAVIYFYSHYFFASAVAHLSAMYAPFLIVAIALGTPPELAALVLAFFSNLFMCLTHYGSGQAPILFGTGYVTVGHWWKAGAICGLLYVVVWIVFGGLWWKVLGLW